MVYEGEKTRWLGGMERTRERLQNVREFWLGEKNGISNKMAAQLPIVFWGLCKFQQSFETK